MRSFFCAVMAVVALLSSHAVAQDPTALRVYSSNGVRIVLQEMQPRIEAAVGKPLSFEFSTARTLVQQLADGAAFDVAVLTPALIDELIDAGRVAADSRIDVARVGIGVGARQGTPARSVATLDELRSTLLAAGSVAFGANGQSRQTNEASFAALGIADDMRAKVRLTGPGEAPVLVAAGEVDLVLTLISELLREPGVQFLGPLPAEVQAYIRFAAGTSAGTHDRAAAAAFVRALSTADFAAALERHGLEPVTP